MPWEKKFDIDETLERAMQVFWRNGYEATSMQDLVKHMGINPGSIYDTYGNKYALFVQALRYFEKQAQRQRAQCCNEKSPREAIIAVFSNIVDAACKDDNYCGCFMVNTALEIAPHNAEIAKIVSKSMIGTEKYFRDQIKKAQQLGEIATTVHAANTARTLLSLITGMQVFSRVRPDRALLTNIVNQVRAML